MHYLLLFCQTMRISKQFSILFYLVQSQKRNQDVASHYLRCYFGLLSTRKKYLYRKSLNSRLHTKVDVCSMYFCHMRPVSASKVNVIRQGGTNTAWYYSNQENKARFVFSITENLIVPIFMRFGGVEICRKFHWVHF